MKAVIFAATILLSLNAFANDGKPKLPRTLECTGDIQDYPKVTIKNLNTAEPSTSIPDAPVGEFEADWSLVRIWASNECENSFTFIFFTDDLQLIRDRKVETIRGMVSYFHTGFSDEELDTPKTAVVTCRLAK